MSFYLIANIKYSFCVDKKIIFSYINCMNLTAKLKANKVLPVAVFDRIDDAFRTADLLINGGFTVLEVTMRTQAALVCIEGLVKKFPELTVGAGSVDSRAAFSAALNSGASFAVSAGFDAETVLAAADSGIPFIPGAATPTELMNALRHANIVKIFPAALLGGVDYLNAVKAPFALKEFYMLPTGGIDETNFIDYLGVNKVIACGMSRVVESKLIAESNFGALQKRIDYVARLLADLP